MMEYEDIETSMMREKIARLEAEIKVLNEDIVKWKDRHETLLDKYTNLYITLETEGAFHKVLDCRGIPFD